MAKEKYFKRLPRRKDEYFIPGGVKVPKPEELEIALRIFKRQLKEDGKLQELRDRRYFEKPSAKKRVQKDTAINMQKKDTKRRLALDKAFVLGFRDPNYIRPSRPKRKPRSFSR
tara:strand:+ start:1072 stop:1413 length:342 start_codon:yes stop_codon:yes gene_type:complete